MAHATPGRRWSRWPPTSTHYTDMTYAETAREVRVKRRAFLRKWRLRCPAVATSLEEAGDRLFTFLRLPPSQWKSARTTNAIERLHEVLAILEVA